MTRIAPHKPLLHRGQAEQPADSRPLNRRTRVVAAVVVGFLVVHVLAVLSILYVAKWAAADTETRLAHLQWAFPPVFLWKAPRHSTVPQAETAPHLATAAAPNDWLAQAERKDTPRPWQVDAQGAVRWSK
ncbi:MAG: hypothetical protein WBK26_10400 [Burkholderiaceae bacterium]